MTERLLQVTFSDGGRFNIYMRWISIAYGPEERKRRYPNNDWPHMYGIDVEAEIYAEFRDMSVKRQIEEARKLPLESIAPVLMREDELLTFGDMMESASHDTRSDHAKAILARYAQKDWESAHMEPLGPRELCKPCLNALIQRGQEVLAMQMFAGLTYKEAHLRAAPYRDILCDECASMALTRAA